MKKILIVDDAAFMRAALRQMLIKNGYEIVGEAENGNDAFEKYKTLMPDIVTMDITMPECTGIEALKMIKKFDKEAKVIMISAMGQEGMVIDSVLAGARSFIVKPFVESKVIEALSQI